MTVRFTTEIIGELRARAVAHNDLVTDAAAKMKIGLLKGLYKRYCSGANAHEHALTKIDEHLARLRGEKLEKAREPFDRGRHPRGQAGRFRSIGGARHDELVDAAQTQVIPETRYSTFGPPAAAAAGVAGGAAVGAFAPEITRESLKTGLAGSRADRLTIRGARFLGRKVGGFIGGNVGGELVVRGPRAISRAAIGQANRRLGTRIPRPSPNAGEAIVERMRTIGARGGQAVGHGFGAGSAFMTNAPASFTRTVGGRLAGGGLRGQIVGRTLAATAGAIFPGAVLYAPALAHAQEQIGPYEDTLFPRRVKKMTGALLDAPEVLAKQAELLASPELAKANVSSVVRAIASRFRPRRPIAGAASARVRNAAADKVYAWHEPQISVKRPTLAQRAFDPVSIGITGAAAGAGLGALSGLALAEFNRRHSRDRRGRFAQHAEMARQGAKIGSAVGLGLGVVAGLAAARQGHTALLRQAIARLRGEGGGPNLPEAMRLEARRTAERNHAKRFVEAYKTSKIPNFKGDPGSPADVAIALRGHAMSRWYNAEGQAIAGGAKAWYGYQLDRAFDAAARGKKQFLAARALIPDRIERVDVEKLNPAQREAWGRFTEASQATTGAIPKRARDELVGLGSAIGYAGEKVTNFNLARSVDPERLNPGQRKLWDSLYGRYQAAESHITGLYEKRTAATTEQAGNVEALRVEEQKLKRAAATTENSFEDLSETKDVALKHIKDFAQEHLGYTVRATNKAAAIAEVNARLPTWHAEVNHRLTQIGEQLPEQEKHLQTVLNAEADDLEATAVPNPFSRSKADTFLRPRPPGSHRKEGFEALQRGIGDAAAKPFIDAYTLHGAEAVEHLDTLLAMQEAALQERIPSAGASARLFAHAAPKVSGYISQAARDYAAMATARREELHGFQRKIWDVLHQNRDPKVAYDTLKGLGIGVKNQGKRAGSFALANYKSLITLAGLGTSFGVFDFAASKYGVQTDRKKWRKPRNLGIVLERPDVIRRPHEVLTGLTYEDRGQRKFLQGIHIRNEKGDHQIIPFGSDVEYVKNAIRGNQQGGGGGGGGGNRDRMPEIKVPNPQAQEDALTSLKRDNHITRVGPEGFTFDQREGGGENLTAENQFRNSFHTDILKWMQDRNIRDTVMKEGTYFDDQLRPLFEKREAAILGQQSRAELLIGNHENGDNRKRGIFAANPAYKPKNSPDLDHADIRRALIKQAAVHPPTDAEKYGLLRRALWSVGNYYGFNDAEHSRVVAGLDTLWHKTRPNENPPAGETHQGGGQHFTSSPQSASYIDDLVASGRRPIRDMNDADFRDYLLGQHHNFRRIYQEEHAGDRRPPTESEVDRQAEARVRALNKATPMGPLHKYTAWAQGEKRPHGHRLGPDAAATPAAPPISGAARPAAMSAPLRPPISGAATHMAEPVSPPGQPRGPSIGHQVRQATRPAHALASIGQYGLGQGAYEAAKAGVETFFPGASKLLSIGTGIAAGVVGTGVGASLGRKAGRALGDKSSDPSAPFGESATRGIAGAAGQIGAVPTLARAGRTGAGQAVARGATTAGKVLGRGVASAASRVPLLARLGRTVAGAEEGGAVGSRFGGAVGAVGGVAAGALAGYLSDEGAGALYRALSRYGPHVVKSVMGHHTPAARVAR